MTRCESQEASLRVAAPLCPWGRGLGLSLRCGLLPAPRQDLQSLVLDRCAHTEVERALALGLLAGGLQSLDPNPSSLAATPLIYLNSYGFSQGTVLAPDGFDQPCRLLGEMLAQGSQSSAFSLHPGEVRREWTEGPRLQADWPQLQWVPSSGAGWRGE